MLTTCRTWTSMATTGSVSPTWWRLSVGVFVGSLARNQLVQHRIGARSPAREEPGSRTCDVTSQNTFTCISSNHHDRYTLLLILARFHHSRRRWILRTKRRTPMTRNHLPQFARRIRARRDARRLQLRVETLESRAVPTASPYLVPTNPAVTTRAILTVG